MLPSFLQYIGPDFNFTLSYVIHNGFELDQDFYGCSGGVPESNHHRRQYWGVYFITVGILILILYSTCLIAIAKSDQMKTSAYKTMLFLGICDLSSTMIHSVATGILGYNGIGFCDYPRLIFTLGSIGLGSWMGCCISSMVLAFIRICDLNSQIKMRKCFAGWKIYVILLVFFMYSLYAMFLSKPVIFNPVYMSWFFDPGVGKDPTLYINVIHTFNNIMMAVSTLVFYGYLAIVFLKESRSSATKKLTKMQVTILLQTFFFCIFHAIGAAIYAYMQFFESSEFIVLVGHLAWQSSSGSVCMVYLTLNRTIRRSVVKLVCSRKYNVENHAPSIISVHPRSRANSSMFEMSNFHHFH
ncbi:hypothetical protein GCK72_020746 [Caenorhabditis remanei]|uniref:Serpentine Receptor, class T n=1 Tax=Caenorhabditis remanei TaxID=31234 RepID=A0A6A5GHP3_CAERE|nr:hypothetical protein GCK72_020746 [Caenorhabditis remanei]KAF1754186.1 hypothetical protein GCK72_020746 [Caenorhabditis remanei]